MAEMRPPLAPGRQPAAVARPALLTVLLYCLSTIPCMPVAAEDLVYQLKYQVEFQPDAGKARVKWLFDTGRLLRNLNFARQAQRISDIKANGELTVGEQRVAWNLPEGEAWLSYTVKIDHERDPGEYDALMTRDWALFRGDDLFPATQTNEVPGAYANASLDIILPETWRSVETGWTRKSGTTFRIDNPERLFDRPTGWMLAGNLGTRRSKVAKTSITVSAPRGSRLERMEILTFLNFVWPEVREAFGTTPRKLLIVGAGDPMWRGGLSASNSLYLHADRPMISENGTSPLLHELTHMVTRLKGVKTDATNDDWIVEGLAEYYSFELLYRAGGMSKSRRNQILQRLDAWSKDVTHLRKQPSTGRQTARAAVLLAEVDREIRRRSKNETSIDEVVRELMVKRQIGLKDLQIAVENLLGAHSLALRSPLIN